jgi:hypothetical protein
LGAVVVAGIFFAIFFAIAKFSEISSTYRLFIPKYFTIFAKNKIERMTFDKITDDGNLYAVRYDGDTDNILEILFDQWSDVLWLRSFFRENFSDLKRYFKIENVNEAIQDTLDDNEILQRTILNFDMEDLNRAFRPLDNQSTGMVILNKEKTRPKSSSRHVSWLRLYAIKLDDGKFLITGGAIKLTHTMNEREHTMAELRRLEYVRSFLISESVYDSISFDDYIEFDAI